MTDSLDINGKKLLPIKEVVSQVDYSRDYVTRLARERKIVATQVGRVWFVDIDSLRSYQEVAQAEQEIKQRQLSDQRKRELSIKAKKLKQRANSFKRVSRKLPVIAASIFVLVAGVATGVLLESHSRATFVTVSQTANIKTGVLVELMSDGQRPLALRDYINPVGGALVPDFAPNVTQRQLPSNQGILLLPNNGELDGEHPEEFFSDPVRVVVDEKGNRSVVQVDSEGNVIGTPVPYVVVPVNAQSP